MRKKSPTCFRSRFRHSASRSGWRSQTPRSVTTGATYSIASVSGSSGQIYQLEQETPGAGLKAFSDLLYAAPESTFLAMLQDGSLTSPFDESRMQELAAYFKEAL